MRRPLVTLAAVLAWIALCLPWQICASDCRTAIVGGWQHDCHLPDAHAGCPHRGHGHRHDGEGDHPGGTCCGFDDGGSHLKLLVPLSEPGAAPQYEEPTPPHLAATRGLGELSGMPRRILARCTGPPGRAGNSLSNLRSVVLLL